MSELTAGSPEIGHGLIMPERTWKRTGLVWLVVVLCIAISAATLIGMSRARKAQPLIATATPAPVVTVDTTRVQLQSLSDELVATGTVRAVDPLSVGSEVSGLRVTSVEVEEGATVRKGQVLATLNPALIKAQLDQTQARYRGSLASITKAAQPNRPQDIATVMAALEQSRASEEQEKANVAQAKTNLVRSQQTADRYSKVVEAGYVTAQEHQDKVTEVERNRAALAAAEHRLSAAHFSTRQSLEKLSLYQAGGRSEDVELARTNSQEVAANVDYLQAQVEQTVIRAPDDGLVLQRDIHLGDIVSNTKSLFTLARLSQMELRAQVPEVDLGRVRVGDTALTTVGGKTVRGKVWMISPAVDSANRLGMVRILLDVGSSRHNQVLPGMFARANLGLGSHKALVIPSSAVMGENDSYFVFLHDNGRARKRAVKTGVRSKDSLEITEGLKPNDEVIVKGAGFLADGDYVALAPAGADK